jgi:hypothetical protein
MENNIKWHHGVPNKDEYDMALRELDNNHQTTYSNLAEVGSKK